MASEHTTTHFSLRPQHSYNSPNLPGLLPKSSQGSLGPTVLLSLLFRVKYGLKIGTPVATLPDAWRYRVSTGTGQPGVSILWLGEVESWISNLYLSVAARKLVRADPSLRYTRMLLGR